MIATVGMIDATHASVGNIPLTAPKVAGYVTGSEGVAWTAADWARFPRASRISIDQDAGSPAFSKGTAEVLDVETGAATIADAVTGVIARHKAGRYSTIYIDTSNLDALKKALTDAGSAIAMNRVGFWIANWNLDQEEAAAQLGNEIVAIQWASPLSNPGTKVPGSSMTLAQANVDLSETLESWYAVPAPDPPWQATALKEARAILVTSQELVTLLEKHQ
jgi:hypothetical protein